MRKDKTPERLAYDLAFRSVCNVMVGAVVIDAEGRIVSWAWNNSGPDGNGMCAERMAISRANRKRLAGSTIYVCGIRRASRNHVVSFPCDSCMTLLKKHGIGKVRYSTKGGRWLEHIV